HEKSGLELPLSSKVFEDVPNLLATASNSFFASSITKYQPLLEAFLDQVVGDISVPPEARRSGHHPHKPFYMLLWLRHYELLSLHEG
ncbi:hypothetical protein, partial [Marinobacter sp. EN3]|uniref:hypothetical protein n=1 Tax=Marinobacter sp. EN3 TaxID=1397533 RepID=UPI001D0D63B6